jgi:hypothetical protein
LTVLECARDAVLPGRTDLNPLGSNGVISFSALVAAVRLNRTSRPRGRISRSREGK